MKDLVHETICKPKDIKWQKVRQLRYRSQATDDADSMDRISTHVLLSTDRDLTMNTVVDLSPHRSQQHCSTRRSRRVKQCQHKATKVKIQLAVSTKHKRHQTEVQIHTPIAN